MTEVEVKNIFVYGARHHKKIKLIVATLFAYLCSKQQYVFSITQKKLQSSSHILIQYQIQNEMTNIIFLKHYFLIFLQRKKKPELKKKRKTQIFKRSNNLMT